MLRRAIAGAGTAALLTSALVAGGASTAEAHPTYHPWGTTASKDHTLRKGCHSYRYRYAITAPTDNWVAEIFIVNSNGRFVASHTVFSESDPDRGALEVRICRPSTVYGKHKIKMKVTWYRGRETTDGYVEPSTFRFKRP